jgi:hypothetical protein
MPTTGTPLRKWTLFLLLCSIPTCAFAQAANDTAVASPGTTASSSTTTTHPPAAASPTPPLPSLSLTRKYTDTASVCPFRTINYITHTLPQQCAKTSWAAPGEAASTAVPAGAAESTPSPPPDEGTEARDDQGEGSTTPAIAPHNDPAPSAASVIDSSTSSADSDNELETDSPFDNANFLSFEEWKKRNLAQVGQSPENVGQGRAAPSNQPGRRRPVNVNALDSLGDEGEIEIDFSGFGPPPEGSHLASHAQADTQHVAASKVAGEDGKVAPSSWALSKDAGKTCKERFNYASFDCAATVLKTNKQAKSSSSILVENKDSYMLNECSADNKFLIVELCDDILVDTIVLANYEFFSSMFRHFTVSVSDRYPVKIERWRTLGTFEARNSRDLQPFLITEPQIWARYLRVEFLTQFGNEFYCPLSLLRVHGTTMMEQFRREEEEARGVEDDDGDLEAEGRDVVKPAEDSGPLHPDQIPVQPVKDNSVIHSTKAATDNATDPAVISHPTSDPSNNEQVSGNVESSPTRTAATTPLVQSTSVGNSVISSDTASLPSLPNVTQHSKDGEANTTVLNKPSAAPSSEIESEKATQDHASASTTPVVSPSPLASRQDGRASSVTNATGSVPSNSSHGKASNDNTLANSQVPPSRGSSTQPGPPVPSTQESFYKSIHKRLLHLEANSTLSLQYIEEQSRILRDAFIKVEKRQLAKTEKFLNHLNSTVMQELKSYRNMYDQLWQSTIIELESMKERQSSEIDEIGTRLTLMADELVWQKRMAVVQSTLLLLCLGLVLFVRSGTLGSTSDVPIVQQLGSKYNSFFESSPPRSLEISGMARRRRTFRNMWRSDTSLGLSDHQSDGQPINSDAETDGARSPVQIQYSQPTPDTPVADPPTPGQDDQAVRIQVLETQSGPATPNGTRDSRPSWEEVDRAIGQLKAEEQGLPSPKGTKKERERKKKRSPLRRAHSSYDAAAEDSPMTDSGGDLFVE